MQKIQKKLISNYAQNPKEASSQFLSLNPILENKIKVTVSDNLLQIDINISPLQRVQDFIQSAGPKSFLDLLASQSYDGAPDQNIDLANSFIFNNKKLILVPVFRCENVEMDLYCNLQVKSKKVSDGLQWQSAILIYQYQNQGRHPFKDENIGQTRRNILRGKIKVQKVLSEIQNIQPNNSQNNIELKPSNIQDMGPRLKTPFCDKNEEITQHFSPNRQNVLVLQTSRSAMSQSQSEMKSFAEMQSEKSLKHFVVGNQNQEQNQDDFDNLPSSFEDEEQKSIQQSQDAESDLKMGQSMGSNEDFNLDIDEKDTPQKALLSNRSHHKVNRSSLLQNSFKMNEPEKLSMRKEEMLQISERKSEKSGMASSVAMSNQLKSFGDFGESEKSKKSSVKQSEKSVIQQSQRSMMQSQRSIVSNHSPNQITFVIQLDQKSAIGISTSEQGIQFIHHSFGDTVTQKHIQIPTAIKSFLSGCGLVLQIIDIEYTAKEKFLVVLQEQGIVVLSLKMNDEAPQISLVKHLNKMMADCICANLSPTPGFWIAKDSWVQLVEIDLSKPAKVIASKTVKFQFEKQYQAKATAIRQSYLVQTNYVDGEDVQQIDSYLAIATSDSMEQNELGGGMDLIILHLQKQEIPDQSTRSIKQANLRHIASKKLSAIHAMDITQIIALSLDCLIKIIEIEEPSEDKKQFDATIAHEILSNGNIINAVPIHGPTSLFAVSTFNEETEENWIQVWRRKTQRAIFGPYECPTLDLKLIAKNQICLPDPNQEGKSLIILTI